MSGSRNIVQHVKKLKMKLQEATQLICPNLANGWKKR